MTASGPAGHAPAGPPPVAVVQVDLGPGVRAGFTTRLLGGAAPDRDERPGNLGLGVGEAPDAVLGRRRSLADWAGGPVAWSTQVHGTAVLDLLQHGDGPAPSRDGSPVGEADALVAGRGTGVAVVVADCVPVLLADAATGVVSAVHAGRRGLADGVVQVAVAAMAARGARLEDLRAAIGPAVCGRCYEVPAALRDDVAAVVPDAASRTSWGTPALDLPRAVAAVLRASGVGHVQDVGLCTRTDERFFSHRRSTGTGEPSGRCAAVVRADTRTAGVSDGDARVAGC